MKFDRPLIKTEPNPKVPINVRQRYLNTFIDEFLKFQTQELSCSKVFNPNGGRYIHVWWPEKVQS